MRVLIHSETGTRHIPKDEDKHQSRCGYNGVTPDARDVWDVGESTHLDDHPEDFGDLPSDCDKCAEAVDA
jgi:hypothetical protein